MAPEPSTNFTVDIEPFDPARHDRTAFSCGSDRIDNYLKRTAKKHQKDDFARVFVAVAPGETGILGYYAINAHGVEAQDLPATLSRKAPRHGYVPAAYLSIIAVDQRVQGQGLGQVLLVDALKDAIAAWVPPKNGLRGGQRRYSNLAVRTALTLRVVFSLPLRQTEGFLDSLLRLMGLNLKAPDHTTLSRRNQIVAVPPLTRSYDGPIDLIVDSTGLKILGCGEWNAHKHKASKKRRDWRKLHIGVDAEGFIVAAELTASSRDDASTLPALLDTIEVPIRRFTADGAYDHRSVYDQLSAAGTENVVIVIPPRRSAVSAGPTDGPWAQRDTALERIRQVGRREWQKESGYRQQARVENSFFRYKSVLGGGLKARHGKAQRREVAIGCHILNRMAELGRPKSCAVVS